GHPAEPVSNAPAGRKGTVGTLLVAVRAFQGQPGFSRVLPENVDDTAHSISSIKIGSRSLEDLDSADLLPRYSIPIYPTAKRIVDRNAVRQHDRAAAAPASASSHSHP